MPQRDMNRGPDKENEGIDRAKKLRGRDKVSYHSSSWIYCFQSRARALVAGIIRARID